ncbi:MAG: gluconate 2-dehydrogenase subunit 3 family protein [Pseudomonadota bacterium]
MTQSNRRQFVQRTMIGTLAFQVAGATSWLTPRQAHAKEVSLNFFDEAQRKLLSSFCEHLLPGATEAGVAEFIDQQLGESPHECMLMCKYFPGINAPYDSFYHGGLKALEILADAKFKLSFAKLTAPQKNEIVALLWEGKADPWAGPPPPLFYMMLRSDAVDVVFGTEQGFQDLGVPYMAHIRPPHDWAPPTSTDDLIDDESQHG